MNGKEEKKKEKNKYQINKKEKWIKKIEWNKKSKQENK